MKGKILYLFVGILLIVGLFFTMPNGLDENTKDLLDKALALDTEEIFPGFKIDKYPQDVNYGRIEYRYYKGQIREQKPNYPLALSAVPTKDGSVTKVMAIKDFRNYYDLGNSSKDEVEKAYISVLAHEAFHCHQIASGYPYPINENGLVDTNSPEAKTLEKTRLSLTGLMMIRPTRTYG